MIPGPDRVIACPHCNGLASHGTLRSGNTFGAQTWTDGKQIAPMLPQPPQITRCPHCRAFYWVEDAREVGHIEPIDEPTADDLDEAIQAGVGSDARRLKALRILAWWARNDDFRDTTGRPARRPWKVSAQARANLEALLDLLDEAEEPQRMMKAEILRELARFEDAKSLLATLESPDIREAASRLKQLCEERDPRLRLLWPELDVRLQ